MPHLDAKARDLFLQMLDQQPDQTGVVFNEQPLHGRSGLSSTFEVPYKRGDYQSRESQRLDICLIWCNHHTVIKN